MSQRDNQRCPYSFTILDRAPFGDLLAWLEHASIFPVEQQSNRPPWKKITVPARLPIFTNDPNEMKVRITKVPVRGLLIYGSGKGSIELLFSRIDCKRWWSKG